jgi:hypothetical protein
MPAVARERATAGKIRIKKMIIPKTVKEIVLAV